MLTMVGCCVNLCACAIGECELVEMKRDMPMVIMIIYMIMVVYIISLKCICCSKSNSRYSKPFRWQSH